MLSIIIALLVNFLIETSVSFSVVVPGDPVVAHVGSTVILSCRISPPENAEALEIRWYRQDQFNNPVLLYNHGKIQDIQEESYRNRTSFTLWSDQSGLKDGDVSLRLEKLTLQDEGPFHCYVSGDTEYGNRKVLLNIIDPPDSSGLWKALFFTVLICMILGLVGFILYKQRHKLTEKKPAKENCEEETMEKLTQKVEDRSLEKLTTEVAGDVNIEELRKHAVRITIDERLKSVDLKISKDRKSVRVSDKYNHTGEGFPYKLRAFGAQKFSSGRHYWEVELAVPPNPPKIYWLIGVVKDGNFNSKDQSFTPSNGYWFLCSDGQNGIYSNTDQSTKLSLTPRPERLGVLLDYDDGQLSFYNVKERKHLLTISTRFSGSVVPLFNPGDMSMLKILDCLKPVESSNNPKTVELAVESSQPLLSDSRPDESGKGQENQSNSKP
ncbi:butyrophilin subfamily 2 member A1-like [Garra rufa]|uniref:butyrophilin subfamily 2 member A1-like n=1 Tax=Garra rufa TaxID=137080 RepID=UPI003CCEAB95